MNGKTRPKEFAAACRSCQRFPTSRSIHPTALWIRSCRFPVRHVRQEKGDSSGAAQAGQKVAFFATHGSLRGGQLPRQAFESAAGLAVSLKVLGQFGCRGKVDPKVIDALMKKPEHKAWAEEALGASGNPDAADLKEAAEFAQAMVGKAY